MTPSGRETAGQRIAQARRRRGLPQAVLAGLVGRSESWLSQVERGKRGIDSHSVLVRLADVLRADIEELTGAGDGDESGRRVHPAASMIEQAMMAYGVTDGSAEHEGPDNEVSLDYLRAKARSAYRSYQATRTTRRVGFCPSSSAAWKPRPGALAQPVQLPGRYAFSSTTLPPRY